MSVRQPGGRVYINIFFGLQLTDTLLVLLHDPVN